jgi:hypothetical protein
MQGLAWTFIRQGMNSVPDVVRCFSGELQGDSLPCAPEGLHVLHIQGTIRLFVNYVIFNTSERGKSFL